MGSSVLFCSRILLMLCLCALMLPVKAEDRTEVFPNENIYPAYLANPLRSTFSVQNLFVKHSSIENTGLSRFDLKLGGRLGVYRKTSSQRIWQFTLEGGFHGQFDRKHSEDNIGWDGIYGMSFDVREHEKLAWRLGLHHISSHIGDEIIQRTGRTRVNYTRQEVRAGLAWLPTSHWQNYAELGWAYDFNNKVLQKPLRYEVGFQYEKPSNVINIFGVYAALDISSYEESNWNINTAFQLGLVAKNKDRRWRFGIEYYDGRSSLGEFFQDNEQYLGIGLWIDI